MSPQRVLLCDIGEPAIHWLAWRRWRWPHCSNAFATGALSGPHDRYQARIAWLVLLPPLFYVTRLYAARAETSAGLMRTRAS